MFTPKPTTEERLAAAGIIGAGCLVAGMGCLYVLMVYIGLPLAVLFALVYFFSRIS